MTYHPTSSRDSLLYEIVEDLPFFLPSRRRRFVEERTRLWEKHIQAFASITHGSTDPSLWRATRIELLRGNLDLLDRKFGILLQFQGLLGIVASMLLGGFKDILAGDPIAIVLLSLFGGLWFTTTFVCVRGVGRIRWGDLWKPLTLANRT